MNDLKRLVREIPLGDEPRYQALLEQAGITW